MKNNDTTLEIIWVVLGLYVLLGVFACAKISEEKKFREEAAAILEVPDLSIYLPSKDK
jgi:hypothetical protein